MQVREKDRRECLFPALEELQSGRKPIGVHSKSKQGNIPQIWTRRVKGVDAFANTAATTKEFTDSHDDCLFGGFVSSDWRDLYRADLFENQPQLKFLRALWD
jgi:hypothetical protein